MPRLLLWPFAFLSDGEDHLLMRGSTDQLYWDIQCRWSISISDGLIHLKGIFTHHRCMIPGKKRRMGSSYHERMPQLNVVAARDSPNQETWSFRARVLQRGWNWSQLVYCRVEGFGEFQIKKLPSEGTSFPFSRNFNYEFPCFWILAWVMHSYICMLLYGHISTHHFLVV